MTDYSKITALYSRLSVGDEDRDGGESNSIQNQKIFLENYARGQHLTNIRHYIDDDESGRFFDRSAYSRMMDDVENGKIGVCIMKDLTRWGRDYLQVGNAMEIFRRNNVRFIAVNNGIDSEKPDTLEFAPFINIMSEWYAKDISKKVKTGIKTKGMSGKPIATEAPYGYMKDPDNKDFWIIDEEAAEVVRLIFRLFIGGKNRNQIAVYLKNEQIPTPTFYMKDRGRGTCKNKALNEDNRYKWNKVTLTHTLKVLDMENMVEQIADDAYEKACEVVADTVAEHTRAEDIAELRSYKKWLTSDERKTPKDKRDFVGKCLDNLEARFRKMAQAVAKKVLGALQSPQIKEQKKEEIKERARVSVRERLAEHQKQVEMEKQRKAELPKVKKQKTEELG